MEGGHIVLYIDIQDKNGHHCNRKPRNIGVTSSTSSALYPYISKLLGLPHFWFEFSDNCLKRHRYHQTSAEFDPRQRDTEMKGHISKSLWFFSLKTIYWYKQLEELHSLIQFRKCSVTNWGCYNQTHYRIGVQQTWHQVRDLDLYCWSILYSSQAQLCHENEKVLSCLFPLMPKCTRYIYFWF